MTKQLRYKIGFASGLNARRAKLSRVLKEKDFGILLVENKDRLTRYFLRGAAIRTAPGQEENQGGSQGSARD